MSLLAASDLATEFPTLTDPQRVILIEAAESEIARRLGRATRQAMPAAVLVPQNTATVESGGVAADTASPATSPIGRATEQFFLRPVTEVKLLELPVGPVTGIVWAKENSTTLQLSKFIVSAWSWRYADPRFVFNPGALYELCVYTGWLATELPSDVQVAVKAQASLIASDPDQVGGVAVQKVIGESIDDYAVRFAQTGGGGSLADAQAATSARIDRLIAPWRNIGVI